MSPDPSTIETLLQARRDGLTLRQAAAKVGVHIATVCRWQAADPELFQFLHDAARVAQIERFRDEGPRPRVQWRRDCPLCGSLVVVRTAGGRLTCYQATAPASPPLRPNRPTGGDNST